MNRCFLVAAALALSSAPAFSQSTFTEGDATNSCAALTGHALNGADNPQINQWIAACSRSTTMDGFVCRHARQEMIKAGEPFASYAKRMTCLPDPKQR